MNNGKTFSSLDGKACSYQCSDQFWSLPLLWKTKRYWISWDLKKPNLFEKILITPGIIWSLKFKTKRITLNKIIRNQGTYFIVIMNNRLKIISVLGAPLKVWEHLFQRKSFSWEEKNFFGKKNYGKVVLNRRTNDQIMSRFGRSFINDNCIFQ